MNRAAPKRRPDQPPPKGAISGRGPVPRYVVRITVSVARGQAVGFREPSKCRPRDRPIRWRPSRAVPPVAADCQQHHGLLVVAHLPGRSPTWPCVMAANLRRLSATGRRPSAIRWSWPRPCRPEAVRLPCIAPGTGGRSLRTRGFSRSPGRYTAPHGQLKKMYVYPLRRGARKRLRARQPCPSWEPQRPDPVSPDVSRCRRCCKSSPPSRITADPRAASSSCRPCWRSELARLSGYRGVDATWRYACALNQEELRTLGVGATS